MSKTLDQLLAECGLAPSSSKGQEKVASAPVKDEVDQVLESLGLNSSATEEESVTKVANDKSQNGGHMGLQNIYDQMFGEETVEKTASENNSENTASEEGESRESVFGQAVAHYFNAGASQYIEKIAADVGEEEQPLAHASTGGQLTGIIGTPKDPQLPVNHSASGGHELKTMTGNTSPYTLAAAGPTIKAILKRKMKAEAGDVGGYHQS